MRRPSSRGFTLIEILVSLAAGGLVLVGLLLLSKNATAAFNEEVRLGALQAAVRSATQRIQGDLTLASYLSTPNMQADPKIARGFAATSNATAASLAVARRLSGVRIITGASDVTALRNAQNGYRNDVLEVSGNLTGSDPFVVLDVLVGGGDGGCDRIVFNMDAPAIWRLRDSTAADPIATLVARVQGLFVPVTTGASQHLVRFVDTTGRSQFLATCPIANAVKRVGGAPEAIAVDVTAGVGNRILTVADTRGIGGWPGRAVGGCTVNPVHVARYEVGTTALLAPSLTALEVSTDANPKFDLYRRYLDATGAVIAVPELVSEFVVGLRFGLTVDSATVGAPGTSSSLQRVDVSDVTGVGTWAPLIDATLARPATTAGSVGPHRIRSVAVEVSARVPLADRDRPEPTGATQRRYCIPGSCVPGTQTYARTRTSLLEVALPNHIGVYY